MALGAHDPADDLVAVGPVERRLGEIAAVEQRHHPVADIEDVVHAVADQDHADAVVLQALDQVEHLADLLDGERRRRLVHDHDLGVEGGGAGDGDRLALAAGQFLDVLVDRFDVDVQPVEMVGRQLRAALLCRRWSAAESRGPARGRDRCSRRSACSRRARGPGRPSRCRCRARRAGYGSGPAGLRRRSRLRSARTGRRGPSSASTCRRRCRRRRPAPPPPPAGD